MVRKGQSVWWGKGSQCVLRGKGSQCGESVCMAVMMYISCAGHPT